MRRYFDLNSAAHDRDPRVRRVACLGFFDGLHRGHRKLLGELKEWAAECGAEPAVVTFDRHPQGVLGGSPPVPVLSLEHRLVLLEREGVGATLVLRFDHELSTWSAETFVKRVFREALGAQGLLMGFDSAFGHRRRGTYDYIKPRQSELELEVRRGEVERLGRERISSTLVRDAVAQGDLAQLKALMGRRYSALGRVAHGDHRGAQLGFPTANLVVGRIALPPVGVYFGQALPLGAMAGDGSFPRPRWQPRDGPEPEDGERTGFAAVINLGRRPTVSGEREATGDLCFDPGRDRFEAHLLDFAGELYGEHLEVFFDERHRDEKKFPSLEALANQIRADVEARRKMG